MASGRFRSDMARVVTAAARLLSEAGSADRLGELSVAQTVEGRRGWSWIALPEWAEDLVPEGKPGFFVPLYGTETASWREQDWWRAAADYLDCAAEIDWERANGPVHSYAARLSGIPAEAFDHAWVNRIVLFLRRWWAVETGTSETRAFGDVPPAIIHLTHDVDAVVKTLPIRLKQAVFSLYNRRPRQALRFLLGPADYWQFDTILQLEARHGRKSLWNVYGGRGGWRRPAKEILMDPAYDVASVRLGAKLRAIAESGHRIGLHPKFDTWRDPARLSEERSYIEAALGVRVHEVRQHWLRFSHGQTWAAQKAAGLSHDFTLGFNDRPGFRNGAALSYLEARTHMRITPMILMDSHLFDYSQLDRDARHATIDRLLAELNATGGEASVIWHQRVFHPDYGWGEAYAYLLERMAELRVADPVLDP
jgi:hypothetical protein